MSWHHGAGTPIHSGLDTLPDIKRLDGSKVKGFIVQFTAPVDVKQIDADHVFQVLIEHELEADKRLGVRCRCPLTGEVVAVKVDPPSGDVIISATEILERDFRCDRVSAPQGLPQRPAGRLGTEPLGQVRTAGILGGAAL